jgi:hypothetical protein
MAALGKPDSEQGAIHHSPAQKAIYAIRDVRRQITYTRIWRTMDAVVQETEDDKLLLICQGKPIQSIQR